MGGKITALLLAILTVLALPMAVRAESAWLHNADFETIGGWEDQNGNAVTAQQEVADTVTTVTEYRRIDFESLAEAQTLTSISGGWNLQNQGQYFGIETVDGSKVLRLTKVADNCHRYLSYYGAAVTAGVTYRITYRAKATQTAKLQTYFASPVTGSDHIAQLNTQWQTVSYEFVSPATQSTPSLYFQWLQGGGSGKIYIDDIVIETVTTTGSTVTKPVQKYFNNFSENTVRDWNVTRTTYAVTEKNGEKALSFTPNGNTYITYYGTPFEAGKTYVISCKVLTDTAISFRLYNDATGTAVYQMANTVPGQWTEYSITVTAKSAVNQPSTYFGNMTGSGTVYIDDVQVQCLEQVPATTYTDGIGNCLNTENSNVLAMKTDTRVCQPASLNPGADYTYSFRVKGVSMGTDFTFGVVTGQTETPCTVTTQWSTVSGVFTADANNLFGFYRSGSGCALIDDVVLAPLNCDHAHQETVDAVEPSCTENGWTAGIKCADCGLIISQRTQIPALGHSFTDGTCVRCCCKEKDVVLRFAVLSDTHLSTSNQVSATNRKNRFTNMFKTAYSYAAKQVYTGLDAVVVVGDLVDFGTAEEYKLFDQLVNANLQAGTTLLTLAGNHEFWAEQNAEGYKSFISAEQNKAMDVATTIGGYTFITLSQRDNDVYTQDQKLWLAEALQQAADDQKPIFTFQHFGISNTVFGMENADLQGRPDMAVTANLFHDEYAKYHQVINFSGHTHTPINTPTIISQVDGYTQVATGTLYDMYMPAVASYGKQPPNSNDIAQYYMVEVHADNTVSLLPYNLLTGDFFKTPATEDGDSQLKYEVDVNDPENWLYTTQNKEQTAPWFAPGGQITFSDVTYKGAKVTFTQARDEHSGVYLYEIVCTPETGAQKSFTIFSAYYFEPMPQTLSYGITGLQENTRYTVCVTPVDFYGNRGEVLTGTLQTASSEDPAMQLQIHYTDKNGSADKDIDLLVSNPKLLTGDYYSIEVIADGVSGKVAASNYNDGTLTIWTSFMTAINKLTAKQSLLIPAGAYIEQVTSAGWKPIEGGDREIIHNDLYLEINAAGTDYADKTTYYQELVAAEKTVAAITQVTCDHEETLRLLLQKVCVIAENTSYLTQRLEVLQETINEMLETIENTAGHIAGWNLILADNIGVQFKVRGETAPDCYVTIAGKTCAVTAVQSDEGFYTVQVPLSAAQMTDELQFETRTDGKTVDNGVYSVRQYADTILQGAYSAETKNLVKMMLCYGSAAQTYFRYNTQKPADAGITVTPAVPTEAGNMTITGNVSGIAYYGASLLHKEKTSLRFYFTADTLAGMTFTLDGAPCTPVSGDGRYYVQVDNILPQELNRVRTLTVSDGVSTMVLTYSPMDYIWRMYEKPDVSAETKALVQALYGYHLAAVAYIAANA